MKKKLSILLLLICSMQFSVYAQIISAQNDVRDDRPGLYLFKNANIHVDPNTTITNGWLLINNDKIEKVGQSFDYPKGTQVIDLEGKHIYPSFIDIYSDYGMPAAPRAQMRGSFFEMKFESEKKGAYAWNQAIRPEVNSAEIFTVDNKTAEDYRKAGFGSVVTHQNDGIFRGTSALVTLINDKENKALLQSKVTANYSFQKGSSPQTYPLSMMGSVALIRQTLYDAEWYKNTKSSTERNLSWDAMHEAMALPGVFLATNYHDVLRIGKLGKEFNTNYIIKSGGDDYKRLDEIKAYNPHLILPVNFPDAPDVEDPIDAQSVALSTLKHWELAPTNPARVAGSGLNFSLTTNGLAQKATFINQLRKAVKEGLSEKDALNALTTNPAKLLKIDDKVGSIKNGLVANFIITDKNIFEEKSNIIENWVQGEKYVITDLSATDISGLYTAQIPGFKQLSITGEPTKPAMELIVNDTTKVKANVKRSKDFLTISYKGDKGTSRLTGLISGDKINGVGEDAEGKAFNWSAVLFESPEKKDGNRNEKKTEDSEKGDVIYPFVAHGVKSLPQQQDMLIKNATVWTNEKEGIINTDVLVKNGKISAVGNNLSAGNAKVIDGTGKHLTTGIIDEHSHIALFSINEVESVSSEVRQEDVINSEDISIYRQLAGGVTTSQLLHGSADPIGGQSAIIKLKWGESPDGLIIPNSPKTIKFALGENVKRGNASTTPNRYPITRMGVEQVFVDAFTRAIEYKNNWETYNKARVKTGLTPPRRDIELDPLVEIINGERNITCHSYVQSEINMLMHLSDSLGFRINTFTHILEGYKMAEQMKQRDIYGSTFADWWGYKMEVLEAIPFNAAVMAKAGITMAINSDDAEMARRLNQEAAKTVLYGGMSEEEAWKMVTLNPAKMMSLGDRLGSIKVGKDADLVLWTDNPLSVYTKPVKTIIDGAVYFDEEIKEKREAEIKEERSRLIQKAINAKSSGSPTARPGMMRRPFIEEVHCDTVMEYGVTLDELDSFLEKLNNTEK